MIFKSTNDALDYGRQHKGDTIIKQKLLKRRARFVRLAKQAQQQKAYNAALAYAVRAQFYREAMEVM